MDIEKVIYKAEIYKEKGKDITFRLEDDYHGAQAALLRLELAENLVFFVEGIKLLAEKDGLASLSPVVIEILKDEGSTAVSRSGNGVPQEGMDEGTKAKLLFLLEVLDRRLADYCELFEELAK